MSVRATQKKEDHSGVDFSDLGCPNVASRDRVSQDSYVGTDETAGLTSLSGGRYGQGDVQAENADYAFGIDENLGQTEMDFLTSHPLQPSTYYDGKGHFQAYIYKTPGTLTAKQFGDNVINHQAYKNTELVESSFSATMDGSIYLFTGTKAFMDVPIVGRVYDFIPVVTKLTLDPRNNSKYFRATWTKADDATAMRFLEQNKSKIPLPAGKTVDGYLEEIRANLGDVKSVTGVQEYNAETGVYFYDQTVSPSGIIGKIANWAGAGKIKGSALKVMYNMLSEPTWAGGRGTQGRSVKTYDGTVVTPYL